MARGQRARRRGGHALGDGRRASSGAGGPGGARGGVQPVRRAGAHLDVLPVDGGGGSALEQSLIIDAAERREERREEGEQHAKERCGRMPGAALQVLPAAGKLRASGTACECDESEVLHGCEVSLEEHAEEQPREDGLHLREQLEGRRVDRLQDEEYAVVVDEVDCGRQHVRKELGE